MVFLTQVKSIAFADYFRKNLHNRRVYNLFEINANYVQCKNQIQFTRYFFFKYNGKNRIFIQTVLYFCLLIKISNNVYNLHFLLHELLIKQLLNVPSLSYKMSRSVKYFKLVCMLKILQFFFLNYVLNKNILICCDSALLEFVFNLFKSQV